ncbi:hypothetical protein M8J77_021186 [Diaphorina citri]|nr:hypothetical protein M8J77_021186 [Diaphorina citri]
MAYPHAINTLCKLFDYIGYTNRHTSSRLHKVKTIYSVCFHCLYITYLVSHFISTVTQSIRYLPEFLQRLVEDLAINSFYWECTFYLINYAEIQTLVHRMEKSFSTANQRTVESANRKATLTVVTFTILGTVALSGSILETYFPVSQQELDLLGYIYNRKFPQRRLVSTFWIPFIDESEACYYQVLYVVELYLLFYLLAMIVVSMSTIPLFIFYIESQYAILGEFIEKIGHIHRDAQGNRIVYTDIVRNESVRVCEDRLRKDFSEDRLGKDFSEDRFSKDFNEDGLSKGVFEDKDFPLRKDLKRKAKLEEIYQEDYCRQIVKFHQMIVGFQNQLFSTYKPYLLVKVLLNNGMLALCMYQASTNPTDISPSRVFKLVSELVSIALEFFFICYCSERMDSCNARLRSSATRVAWESVSPRVRKTMLVLLKMVGGGNHLALYCKSLVIGCRYYLDAVKLALSFANFMRLQSSRKRLD